MPRRKLRARGRAAQGIERGAEQQLQDQGDARVAGARRRRRREVSARRIAADAEPSGIDRPARGIGRDGEDGGEGVIVGGGITPFRRQPIVYRDDPASGMMRERRA